MARTPSGVGKDLRIFAGLGTGMNDDEYHVFLSDHFELYLFEMMIIFPIAG